MIKLSNIEKSFGPIKVLRGLDLSVEAGKFISIRGKSGVGKTTLLRIAGLLERPDSGLVEFQGENVKEMNDGERSRIRLHRIGFIHQFHNLIPTLTVLENVELPLCLAGASDEGRGKKARSMLEYFGLEDFERRNPESLSGGERQRVATARAIVNDPDLILADEPTASLDDENSSAVIGMLERINREKKAAVVLTTTDRYTPLPTDVDYALKDGLLKPI